MCKKKVVIIGGGLGGLFSGAFLAKKGFEVSIVEKCSTIGGGLQSFRRFGEVFDTGIHVVGGLNEGGNLNKICKYLGIYDRIETMDVDTDCTDMVYISSDKTYYRIGKGKTGFIDSLSAYFPHQRENLERYVDAMYSLADELDLFYLRHSTGNISHHSEEFILPADDFIAKYITDKRLRGVLSYLNLLYAGVGGTTPAFIHAIISVLYLNGPTRFVGGSYKFAELLADVIKDNGGSIILNDAVEMVITEKNRVVECVTGNGVSLKGDYFVSAIHPCSFLKLLDNTQLFSKAYRTRLDSIPNSYSGIILNIKFKSQSFKFLNYVGHYMQGYSETWIPQSKCVDWPNIFVYMTPPTDNQGEYATTMNIIAPMTWDTVAKWEDTLTGRRGIEYVEWKNARAQVLIEKLEKIYPGFSKCIENLDVASPLTLRDYYGVKQGALYGYMKDCNNMIYSKVPVKTKIPNLFYTGQNNNLHGFCGVALTSIITCSSILGDDSLINDINECD